MIEMRKLRQKIHSYAEIKFKKYNVIIPYASFHQYKASCLQKMCSNRQKTSAYQIGIWPDAFCMPHFCYHKSSALSLNRISVILTRFYHIDNRNDLEMKLSSLTKNMRSLSVIQPFLSKIDSNNRDSLHIYNQKIFQLFPAFGEVS